ncbi:hypothetical protein R50345_22740 [Paenibacillus sp. FSL R5-0345]|uniref:sigma-70 family RNA polymerase sigma factor n=1 Tax=Paenibacillus sp. FSL R5-0345 TaxID=1536770 RepID=UPI0004F5A1F9|nr:sigma-70 family RNA polymerase sigma factor [Paenibacillus sp. FSL R5-0345]AIQ37205.1 hypothetical protein R50345_22740 [Paenibacillus sp. FSL R5-0345]
MDYQAWRKGFERQFVVFMKIWLSPPSGSILLHSTERAQLWRCQSQLVFSQMERNVDKPMELIEEAYSLLEGLLSQKTHTAENVNATFSNPLVQVVISRTIQRVIACCWYAKPSMLGLYQDSYLVFSDVLKRFWEREHRYGNLSDGFLMYLGRFLYLRLKHGYMIKQLGYKYDRKAHKYRLKVLKVDLRYWTPKGSLTGDVGSHLMDEETEKEIVQYVNEKNPVQARIAYLRLQGYKEQSIADECGVPINTVKYHVRRIKEHTRIWMASS